MMSLQAIRELSEEAAKYAEGAGTQPMVIDEDTLDAAKVGDLSGIHIPNLGTFLPKGWARVSLQNEENDHGVYMDDNDGYGAYFVDKSGFGRPGESALTLSQFIDKLKPGLGYGMVEEGQFQVKVGVFALQTGDVDEAERRHHEKIADHIDGYDRDDLGESPDF